MTKALSFTAGCSKSMRLASRSLLVFVWAGLLAAGIACAQEKPSPLAARLELADVLLWQKKYAEAIREYQAVLDAEPASLPALKGLAQAHYWSGHYQDAGPLYQQLLKHQPDDVTSRANLASIFSLEGRYAQAAEQYRLLLASNPQSVAYALNLADNLSWAGRRKEAAGIYEHLHTQQPGSFEIVDRYSTSLIRQKDWQRAAVLLQRFLQRTPSPKLQRRLAEVLAWQQDFGAALPLYQGMLAEHPDDQQLRLSLAQTATWGRKYPEAIKQYRLLLQKDPGNTSLQTALAEVYTYQGDFHSAISIYEHLVAQRAAGPEMRAALASCLLWSGQPDRAMELFAELSARDPGRIMYHAGYIRACLEQDDLTAARRRLRDMQDKFPESHDSMLLEAAVLRQAGYFTRALSGYEQLISQNVGDTQLYSDYLQALCQKGLYKKAVQITDNLLATHPGDAIAQRTKARVLGLQHHFAEAEELLSSLMQARPDDPGLLEERARLYLAQLQPYRAAELCQTLLSTSPTNRPVRFLLAEALAAAGEYQAAEKLLSDLLSADPDDCQSLIRLARLYCRQRRFPEASLILDQLPPDETVLLEKARLLCEQHCYAAAIELLQPALQTENEPLQDLLLEAFLQDNRFSEAREYIHKLSRRRAPDWHLDLFNARVAELDVTSDDARGYYEDVRRELSDEPYSMLFLARCRKIQVTEVIQNETVPAVSAFGVGETLRQLGDREASRLCFEIALKRTPDSPPAMFALAAAYNALGQTASTYPLYQQVLVAHPLNDMAQLGLARTYGSDREYTKAGEAYAVLSRRDAHNPVYVREQARLLIWDHQYDQAFAEYRSSGTFAEPVREPLLREAQAKNLVWHKKYPAALQAYEKILKREPDNEEALFDQAQLYWMLGDYPAAHTSYRQVAGLNPFHFLARETLPYARRSEQTVLEADYGITDEKGRGKLKDIQVQRLGASLTAPITTSRNLLTAGYAYSWYNPGHAKHREARSLHATWSYRFSLRCSAELNAAAHYFTGRLDHTYTYGAKVSIRLWQRPVLSLGFRRADILDNRYTFERHVYCDNYYMSLDSFLAPRVSTTLQYTWGKYSDGNYKNEVFGSLAYHAALPPKELRISANTYYMDVAFPNRYGYRGEELRPVRHPYWAPEDYAAGFIDVHWRHDLARHIACGSRRVYYELGYSAGIDTDHYGIQAFRGALSWDLSPHWKVKAYGMWHNSHPYENKQANISISCFF